MMGKTLETTVNRCRPSRDQRVYQLGVHCPNCELEHMAYRVPGNDWYYLTAPCDIEHGTLLKYRFTEAIMQETLMKGISA